MINRSLISRPLKFLLFLGIFLNALTGVASVTKSKVLEGLQFSPGVEFEISTSSNPTSTPTINNEMRISLSYVNNIKNCSQVNESLTVDLTIESYDDQHVYIGSEDVSLSVNYTTQGEYIDIDLFKIGSINNYTSPITKCVVKVNGVSNPSVLNNHYQLKLEYTYDQVILFQASANNIIHKYDATSNEIEFAWEYIYGADEYQLAYLFLSDYNSAESNAEIFSDDLNWTVVNTKNQFFKITNAFEKGTLYYKIRGKKGMHNSVYTGWSSETLSFENWTDYYRIERPYEGDKNWNYQIVFSDKGRSSEAVSFLDGTLRSRQQLSKNKEDNVVVVSESFYDYDGRPAVQVLPGIVNGSNLKFYENYTPFGKANYATDDKIDNPDPIEPIADNPLLGEYHNNYFSNKSSFVNSGVNGYIPDAEGYNYIQTVFDRKGRVKKVSGVGANHKIGSGHEVEIMYGTPSQDKLDRWFGNEAGYSAHYSYTIVKDPNGQKRATYYDLSGRVIATSLVGNVPDNLDALPGINAVLEIHDLNGDNQFHEFSNPFESVYEVASSITLSIDGDFTLNYGVTSEVYNSLCTNSSYNCAYDLHIKIINHKGELEYENIEVINAGVTKSVLLEGLSAGEYSVYKSLRLNRDKYLEVYALYEEELNNIIAGNITSSCFQDELAEINAIGQDLANIPCSNDCEENCVYGAYLHATELADAQYDKNLNPTDWQGVYDTEYDLFLTDCNTECATGESPNLCEDMLTILVNDVIPGGQYYEDDDWWNGTGFWQNNLFGTSNNAYNRYINRTENGFYAVSPKDYTKNHLQISSDGIKENIDFDNVSQANLELLATRHPEYVKYKYCDMVKSNTDLWLYEAFLPVESYQEAVQLGFIDDYSTVKVITDDVFHSNVEVIHYRSAAGGNTYAPFSVYNDFMTYRLNHPLQTIPVLDYDFFKGVYDAISTVLDKDGNLTSSEKDIFENELINQLTLNQSTSDKSIANLSFELADANNDGLLTGGELDVYWNTYKQWYLKARNEYEELVKKFFYISPRFWPIHLEGGDLTDLFNNLGDPSGMANAAQPTYEQGQVIRFPDFYFDSTNPPSEDQISDWVNSVNNSSPCEKVGSRAQADVEEFSTLFNIEDANPTQTCTFKSGQGGSFTPEIIEYKQDGTQHRVVSSYSSTGNVGTNDFYGQDFEALATSIASNIEVQNLYSSTNNGSVITTQHIEDEIGMFNGNYIEVTLASCYDDNNTFVKDLKLVLEFEGGHDAMDCGTLIDNEVPNCLCEEIDIITQDYPTNGSGYTIEEYAFEQWNTILSDGTDYTVIQNAVLNNFANWQSNCQNHNHPEEIMLLDYNNNPVYGNTIPSGLSECYDANLCEQQREQEIQSLQLYFGEQFKAEKLEIFNKEYFAKCLAVNEDINVEYTEKEHHVMLYTYNQNGQLTHTIPPTAFKEATAALLQNVKDYRDGLTSTPVVVEDIHEASLFSNFSYSTIGGLVESTSPDAGKTTYIYDEIGRVILSQNAKQAARSGEVYSYTVYTRDGRIDRVGELVCSNPSTNGFKEEYKSVQNFSSAYISWVNSCRQNEVTKSFYNEPISENAVLASFPEYAQKNQLRNRVATVAYYNTYYDNAQMEYNSAIHYVYDEHGILKMQIQDNKKLFQNYPNIETHQRFKVTEYEFNIGTGTMDEIVYQRGQKDALYQKFTYDEISRLKASYSSEEGVLWDKDVTYIYAKHGALNRVELGDQQVQGMDFAYNIMGWLKAINSETLSAKRDIGKDGALGGDIYMGLGWNTNNEHQIINTSLNKEFARDIFGATYHYFEGDYKPISSYLTDESSFQATVNNTSDINDFSRDMFNGSISRHTTALTLPNSSGDLVVQPQTYIHHYDQLGRLTQSVAMRSADDALFNNNHWSSATFDSEGQGLTDVTKSDYYTEFSYDAAGNITKLIRNGYAASGDASMDHFQFEYDWKDRTLPINERELQNSNQLYHVTDLTDVNSASHSTVYTDDMDDNGAFDASNLKTNNNYKYDEIGSIVQNLHDEIQLIEYTAARKVKKVTRTIQSLKPDLEFIYNAFGLRIAKIIKPRVQTSTGITEVSPIQNWKIELYAKGPSGNTNATYSHTFTTGVGQTELKDLTLYGASRIGSDIRDIEMDGMPISTTRVQRDLGNKQFYLVNHLGSVMSTITDRKICTSEVASKTTINTGFESDDLALFDKREIEYNLVDYTYSFEDGQENWTTSNHPATIVGNTLSLSISGQSDRDAYITTNFQTEVGEIYTLKFDFLRDKTNLSYHLAVPGLSQFQSGSITEVNGSYEIQFTAQSDITSFTLSQNNIPAGELDYMGISNVELSHQEWISNGYNHLITKTNNGGENSIYLNSYPFQSNPRTVYGPYTKLLVKPGDILNLSVDAWVVNQGLSNGAGIVYDIWDTKGNRLQWNILHMNASSGVTFGGWSTGELSNYVLPDFGEEEMIITIMPLVTPNLNPTYFDNLKIEITPGSATNFFVAEQVHATDYYPYGMAMPGRGYNTSDATFGYQGSRQDKEMYGNGNHYTTDFRQLDSRIGRWTQPDPVFQPWQSPYNSMDGNPINFTDVRGLYIDNGDGTYSLEKDETVGQMYDKLVSDGVINADETSYDAFAKQNNLDRSTGLINGEVVKSSTRFTAGSPAKQKNEALKAEIGHFESPSIEGEEELSWDNREGGIDGVMNIFGSDPSPEGIESSKDDSEPWFVLSFTAGGSAGLGVGGEGGIQFSIEFPSLEPGLYVTGGGGVTIGEQFGASIGGELMLNGGLNEVAGTSVKTSFGGGLVVEGEGYVEIIEKNGSFEGNAPAVAFGGSVGVGEGMYMSTKAMQTTEISRGYHLYKYVAPVLGGPVLSGPFTLLLLFTD